ncbi:hypothetical protein N9L68_00330 [bacterium]|nr:hypothetical protein [bacterium]
MWWELLGVLPTIDERTTHTPTASTTRGNNGLHTHTHTHTQPHTYAHTHTHTNGRTHTHTHQGPAAIVGRDLMSFAEA